MSLVFKHDVKTNVYVIYSGDIPLAVIRAEQLNESQYDIRVNGIEILEHHGPGQEIGVSRGNILPSYSLMQLDSTDYSFDTIIAKVS